MSVIIKLSFFFEKHGFHVSSRLADTLGMRASRFACFYLSFVTAGLGLRCILTLVLDAASRT
jgi:hypothetical protein